MAFGTVMPMINSYPAWDPAEQDPESKGKRRSHIEVQASILKALASEYLTINQLAIRVNLNRVLAKTYVKELSQKGRIERKKTKRLERYSATQRGVAWLKRFESLVRD